VPGEPNPFPNAKVHHPPNQRPSTPLSPPPSHVPILSPTPISNPALLPSRPQPHVWVIARVGLGRGLGGIYEPPLALFRRLEERSTIEAEERPEAVRRSHHQGGFGGHYEPLLPLSRHFEERSTIEVEGRSGAVRRSHHQDGFGGHYEPPLALFRRFEVRCPGKSATNSFTSTMID